MNIFNNNIDIEQLAFYAIDWATYLRKDLSSPFNPFIIFKDSERIFKRVLVTEGDPIEHINDIIKNEKEPFQQFAYCIEGRTLDDNGKKVDTIIAAAFDVSLEKGTMIGQQFKSKEEFGQFKLSGRISLLDNPPLPIEVKPNENDKVSEATDAENDVYVNGMTVKENDTNLIKTISFFTHSSISLIRNAMKNVIFNKLSNDANKELSGNFEFIIVPTLINFGDFEKYIIQLLAEEIPTRDIIQNWEKATGRKVTVLFRYDKEEIARTKEILTSKTDNNFNKYTYLNEEGLTKEFFRIVAIPNAQTNVEALTDMTALMKEFERRNIPLPEAKQQSGNKMTLIWVVITVIILIFLIKNC